MVGHIQRAPHVRSFADSGRQGAVVRTLGGPQKVDVDRTSLPVRRSHQGELGIDWGLPLYSSRDRELLAELIADARWSNEGCSR